MTDDDTQRLLGLNDRYLAAAVGWVRALLVESVTTPNARNLAPIAPPGRGWWSWLRRAPRGAGSPGALRQAARTHNASVDAARRALDAVQADCQAQFVQLPLDQLTRKFGLTEFDRQVLLLCLAFELDSRVGELCGQSQARPSRPYPTFALAMILFGGGEWSAVPPDAPLRRCGLVELRQPVGTPVLFAELRLAESVLHFLRGMMSLDPRLQSYGVRPLPPVAELRPWQVEAARELWQTIESAAQVPGAVMLIGAHRGSQLGVLQAVVERVPWRLMQASLESLPTSATEFDEMVRLWRRDRGLYGLALVVDMHQAATEGEAQTRVGRFAALAGGPLFLLAPEPVTVAGVAVSYVQVPTPPVAEQFELWNEAIPSSVTDRTRLAGELSRQTLLDGPEMLGLVRGVNPNANGHFAEQLRARVRQHTRPHVHGLAQQVAVKAEWDDLILDSRRQAQLRQICSQVRGRWQVYDRWGLAARMNRGLGISALFAGESGTGKTMAAEVIARELQLDLYRVDLSSVVNKYIGETEKHLRRLFDAFESCGAILLFDECDALFGKRTEVKDSHDRYANIEINYLLQRLESYAGLAILATNNRAALDTAFLRRLRFVVAFSLPDATQRERIWRRQLTVEPSQSGGAGLPVAELDFKRLAQFPFTGGNIHNAVINAAFRASARATGDQAIDMPALLAAARDELIKLERPINEADFAGADALEECAA